MLNHSMLMISTLAFFTGFLLDLLVGDPHGWPHLVRGFGAVISFFEKWFYPIRDKRLAGILLVFYTLLVCTGLPFILLYFAWQASPWLYFILETLLCFQLLATKSLRDESRVVYDALAADDLPKARKAVSMIVGRDTAELDASGITRATVETVAENASDGVIAPMFYILLGGAGLGCFHKAVNTLDSMVGYKNERYLKFGRFAAKTDDVVNYIPARFAAILMIAAAWLCKLNAPNAFRIWRRDCRKHASPNSAQTEAVMAGALGTQLAGDALYLGKIQEKPFIGDSIKDIEPADILRAHKLLYTTSCLMLIFSMLGRGILYAIL